MVWASELKVAQGSRNTLCHQVCHYRQTIIKALWLRHRATQGVRTSNTIKQLQPRQIHRIQSGVLLTPLSYILILFLSTYSAR